MCSGTFRRCPRVATAASACSRAQDPTQSTEQFLHGAAFGFPLGLFGDFPYVCSVRVLIYVSVTVRPPEPELFSYCRGLNFYLYYFGGSLLSLYYNGPQNPILIIKASILRIPMPWLTFKPNQAYAGQGATFKSSLYTYHGRRKQTSTKGQPQQVSCLCG